MIITEDDLENVRLQQSSKRIVLTGGGFDLLHVGHLEFLEFCKNQGDVLVVALANDQELGQRKGDQRPIVEQENRARLVDGLRVVDYTLIRNSFGTVNSLVQISRLLSPNALVLYQDIPDDQLNEMRVALPSVEIIIDTQRKLDSTSAIITRVTSKATI